MAQKNRKFFILLLSAVVLVLVTRMCALMHNSALHPDEPVFYKSAYSLTQWILGDGVSYNTVKYYPEGGFVLQMPFHIIARLIFHANESNLRYIGRIAGMSYFVLGVIAGMYVIKKIFHTGLVAQIVYIVIMIFGIIHIEQSRYATGDTASFLFLMLLLLATNKAYKSGCLRDYLTATFFCGVLTAIKYPFIQFVMIPLLCFLRTSELSTKERKKQIIMCAATCIIGFFTVSPASFRNPLYIILTAAHETHNYMGGTNLTEVGGPINHFLSLILFCLFYAGLPIITAPVIWKKISIMRHFRHIDKEQYLVDFVIPATFGIFFVYNLFVTTMFMRTYYLFFCMLDIYCAVWCEKNGETTR